MTTGVSTSPSDGMLAGDVAKTLGVGVQTLHYYEREALIPPAPRTHAGYRRYPPEVVERVRFIRKAQALGLALHEIKEILGLVDEGACPCGHVHAALAQKLEEVDRRLRELRSFRRDLAGLVARAAEFTSGSGARVPSDTEQHRVPVCAIVEEVVPLARSVPSASLLGRRAGKVG